MAEYTAIPFPPPTVNGEKCGTCDGAGLTEDKYEMQTGGGRPPLLIDVFCPTCGGCGSADPEHEICDPKSHYWYDSEDDIDLDPEQPVCPSCHDRGWNVIEGFRGEGENVEGVYTRTPCGCTESRSITVTA